MRQLSGQDAAFLYGETNNWHMHVTGLMIVDAESAPDGWSFEKFRKILISRLPEVPQLRWRLVDVPLGIDRPSWVEDPEIDPDFHIRHIAVPPPGGEAELGALVGQLVSYQLDRSRPLWEAWCIEGLEGGRVAILQKMHHAIVDGMSGAGLAEILLDLEPIPRESTSEMTHDIGSEQPSQVEMLIRAMLRTATRTPFRMMRFFRQSVEQVVAVAPILRGEKPVSLPLTTPWTILNRAPSGRRAFSSAKVDLERVKAVKAAAGVKLNDVVLALVSGSLRNYLSMVDSLPESTLVVQCPVSLRSDTDKDAVGNNIGSIFPALGTDIDDPAERLAAIHESTRSSKEMREAMAARQIMGLTDVTPPGLITLAARMYTSAGLSHRAPPPVSTIVSNVPGPDFPLYIAGGKLESLYPMGPLLVGMSTNITVFSFNGQLQIGVMSCPDTIPEPHLIAEGMEDALAELERSFGL